MRKKQTDICIDEDHKLWILLHQVFAAMLRARNADLERAGISTIRAGILFTLTTAKVPPTLSDISRWLIRRPHSVCGVVNRMEKEGLVKKVRDLKRKNLVRVAMTEKGEYAWRQSSEMNNISEVLSYLSNEERDSLRAILEKLRNKTLEKLEENYEFPFL